MLIPPVSNEGRATLPVAVPPPAGSPALNFAETLKLAQPAEQPAPPRSETYTVKRGDSLWKIARTALAAEGERPTGTEIHQAVKALARHHALQNPDMLSIGQKLDLSILRRAVDPVRPSASAGPLVFAVPAGIPAVNPLPAVTAAPVVAPDSNSGEGAGGPPVSRSDPPLAPSLLPPAMPSPGRLALDRAEAVQPVDLTALIQSILEPKPATLDAVLTPSPHAPWKALLGGPGRLTSEYGMRKDPFTGEPEFHDGIDIAAKVGTPIYPFQAGTVKYSGWKSGHGRVVIVGHADGSETLYAHASKTLVKTGDEVAKDTIIAEVGSTGRSTGPHLHFELRRAGKSINPIPLIHDHSLHVAKAL